MADMVCHMKHTLLCVLMLACAVGCDGSGGKGNKSTKSITIGTPGVSFHQVANYVVVRAMERLGYTVTVMDQLPHRIQYPHFTASKGPIDIFTGSDLPYNHAPWLWNYTDSFLVTGTVNEATDILLGAPSYATVGSVSEFAQQKSSFLTTILSLDTNTCPQCVMMSQSLAKAISTAEKTFVVAELPPSDFISTVKEYIGKKEQFVISWYVPCWIIGELPGMKMLSGDMEPYNRHNAGKTLIRRDRMGKLDATALSVLSSVFVGNDAITVMDADVNKHGLSPAAAADQWIKNNSAMFESFFTKLSQPELLTRHKTIAIV